MPDTIQFGNGNRIIHRYDAEGTRWKTTYYTRRTLATNPIGIGQVGTMGDNLSLYFITSKYYNENIEYEQSGNGSYYKSRIGNPEGCMWYLGNYEEHYPLYYVRDHQGNIRETYIDIGCLDFLQQTQYYPSGLPWNVGLGVNSDQPYKYGGKEWIEMHSLDEYDSKARWYYPAVMRTTTMDPLCEKYYSTSPYAWCNNNPVNLVDHHGDSLSIAEDQHQYIYECLSNAYGETIANQFEYTPSGHLIYGGNIDDITDTETRELVSQLHSQLLGSEDNVSVTFTNKDMILPDGSRLSSSGGAVFLTQTGEIIIGINAPHQITTYRVLPAYYINGGHVDGETRLFKSNSFETNLTDRFFHEVGEYIMREENTAKVLDFNNIYRLRLGLRKRPYDEKHNRLVK